LGATVFTSGKGGGETREKKTGNLGDIGGGVTKQEHRIRGGELALSILCGDKKRRRNGGEGGVILSNAHSWAAIRGVCRREGPHFTR